MYCTFVSLPKIVGAVRPACAAMLASLESHGLLLNLAANFQVPISYLTTGQNVPHDIEVATPERMAELVLGEARG